MGDRRLPAGGVALALALLPVVSAGCAGAGRPTLSEDTAPPLACSAEGLSTAGPTADGASPAIAATGQAIIEAAARCDYDALTELGAGGPVSVILDGAEVPVTEWERREAEGEPILRSVAGILGLTPAGPASDGSMTWPSAVDWQFSDVAPGEERQALVAVVGESGVFGWAETGGYAGWRTTIEGDGTWSSVVLGPAPG